MSPSIEAGALDMPDCQLILPPDSGDVVAADDVRSAIQKLFEGEDLSGKVFSDLTAANLAYAGECKNRAYSYDAHPHPMRVAVSDENPYGRYPFDGVFLPGERLRIFSVIDGRGLMPIRLSERERVAFEAAGKGDIFDDFLSDPFTVMNTKSLPFESVPTDAMTMMVYDSEFDSWRAQVLPHGALTESSWACFRHYSGGFIGGMQALQSEDGVYVFRLNDHVERLARDGGDLNFPPLNAEFLKYVIGEHLKADLRWIPSDVNAVGNRYYLRPVANPDNNTPKLAGKEKQMMIMGSPVGPYKVFGPGARLKVCLLGERPVVPGRGVNKTSFNYLDAVLAFKPHAVAHGYHEGIFMNGCGVQEGVAANIMARFSGKGVDGKDLVITPDPAYANVLPGVTMSAAMELADYWWCEVRYEPLALDDLLKADEIAMTGTAMGIVPVETIHYQPDQPNILAYSASADGGLFDGLADAYQRILRRQHKDPALNAWMQKVV